MWITYVKQILDNYWVVKFKNYKNFIGYIDRKYCKIEKYIRGKIR